MMGRITTELDGIEFEGVYNISPQTISISLTKPYEIYVPLKADIFFGTSDREGVERLVNIMLRHYGKTLIEIARNKEKYLEILNQYWNDRNPYYGFIGTESVFRQGFDFFGYNRTDEESGKRRKYAQEMMLQGLPVIPIRAIEIIIGCLDTYGCDCLKRPDKTFPPPYLELYTSTIA